MAVSLKSLQHILLVPVRCYLTGRITDANTGSVIDFADVLLFKSGDSKLFMQTLPDENGNFSFSSVEEGNYSLIVCLVGYDIFTAKFWKSRINPVSILEM